MSTSSARWPAKKPKEEVPLPDGTKLEARTANLRRAKVAILAVPAAAAERQLLRARGRLPAGGAGAGRLLHGAV